MRSKDEMLEYLKTEEERSFSGWDFSYINGRIVENSLPWDYRNKVNDFLKPTSKILDMGTGGGEFLLSLQHPYAQTSVTEGYEPNYLLCKEKLEPLGITVKKASEDELLDFPDESFDIVLNRHESYNISEVRRVLKSGGFFITQQVGGENNAPLIKAIIENTESQVDAFNLENEKARFEQAGFRIMYHNQCYADTLCYDVGAVVYYAKVLPWEFPGFSVERDFSRLVKINEDIEKHGSFKTIAHRFIIIAKK